MLRITCLSFLLAAVASANINPQVLQQLKSPDMELRDSAWKALQAAGAEAGRPGEDAERIALCEQICEELEQNPPADAARLMMETLLHIGREESVPTLTRLLIGRDEKLSGQALRALTGNPAPDAGRVLMLQLKKDQSLTPRETVGLINALGTRSGMEEVVPILENHLKSSDPLVYSATVKALIQIGNLDAMRLIARQLRQEQGERKATLGKALLQADEPAVFEQLYTQSETPELRALAFLSLLLNGQYDKVSTLSETGDPLLWSALFEAAVQTKHQRLFDWISIHLNKLPPLLQLQALGALEVSGDSVYAPEVEPLLNSDTDYLKSAAAEVLGNIGRSETAPLLLASDNPAALTALGRLQAAGVDEALQAEAAGGSHPEQQARAIRALALRGRQDAMKVFFHFAKGDEPAVAAAGVEAIGLLGGMQQLASLTDLLLEKEQSRLSRTIQEAAITIMRRSEQPEEAVAVLKARLGRASLRGKAMILQVLAQVGSPEALEPIVTACHSPDEALRKLAFKLLGGWQNPVAIPDMLKLAADSDTGLTDHVQLMRGITRLLVAERKLNEPYLFQALDTCRRADEKKVLIPLLAKARDPEAEALLEKFRSDPELKKTAEETLSKKK